MLGTAFETHGGIASVVSAWRAAGLFTRWPVEYVETHCDGSFADKLACALGALGVFATLLVRHRRAVLHVHCASRASFWRKSVFMALARLAGWPILLHLHGGGFAAFFERRGPIGRAVVRSFLDRAACIVVPSERWAAWVRSKARNPNVTVLAQPVALPPGVPLVRNGALVSFVGRVDGAKGVFDLVDAVAELRAQIPAVSVELAGDGDVAAVRRGALERGLGASLRLPGWIDAARRDGLLARSTVFVLPSHAEALPMSLLEAMAAGCPVVATAVGGIPDVIRDGENGLLVPPRDPKALAMALQRVITDRALAPRLGHEARETIRRDFGPRKSIEQLERMYVALGTRGSPSFSAAPWRGQVTSGLEQ